MGRGLPLPLSLPPSVILSLTLSLSSSPSSDAVDDKRLVIVRELLRTEDNYLENLRNIFDVYMEPLR